ncbi:NupC/NupG family nucleoside CNT transporter [Litorimonas sp.]|uniref:NupC/NupG family nucleoside CNT transporter n=1 Tax=Litorimonas sp. TaxID=1892381 RepID=UPI003A8C7A16
MTGLIGIVVLLGIAFLFSESRKSIKALEVGRLLLLQTAIALFALFTPIGVGVLSAVSRGVQKMLSYAQDGISFMFGPIADPANGMVLAFQVLPVIIFIGALMSLLFYFRIMDIIIKYLGGALRFLTGTSRLESICAAANVFVGMAEAPLTIAPYLKKITRSQLFVMMALGLSSVAGTVLFAYAALGIRSDLLITAAFMSAPGGLLMGRMLVPETEMPFDITKEDAEKVDTRKAGSFVEAATNGALTGLQIMLSVIAVLIAFLAVIALLNGILGGIGGWFGADDLSLEGLFSWIFQPLAFIIGVPWEECREAGIYLGQKVILNEFLAYASFAPKISSFSNQGQIAITMALCGFANFSGLAILLAGLSALVPERKSEISKLGLKTVLAGNLSNFMSASIVSVLLAIAALI